MTAIAVGPTPTFLASAAASANYAMGCLPSLKPDFPAQAIGAIIEQCCGEGGLPSQSVNDIATGSVASVMPESQRGRA